MPQWLKDHCAIMPSYNMTYNMTLCVESWFALVPTAETVQVLTCEKVQVVFI